MGSIIEHDNIVYSNGRCIVNNHVNNVNEL